MSLFKNRDGVYEGDVRVIGVGRIHLSMRTKLKATAEPRYQAVKRLFREAKGPEASSRLALIDMLRAGDLSIERLESMVREGAALAPERQTATVVWPTIDQEVARYLDWIAVNPQRRKATWEAVGAQLRRLANFVVDDRRIGDRRLDELTSAHVEAYQRSLIEGGSALNTITSYMSRVSSLFKWIQRQENRAAAESRRAPLLVHSPVDRDTLHRETSRRDRWITKEEAERLLAVTPAPLQFAVAAGMFGGFRIGEVLHLRTYVDVDLSLETITIAPKQVGVDAEGRAEWWKPKTPRAARVVPVAPDLMPILERQVMSFASDHWLMPALADETRPYGYHSFRASFALIVADAEMVTGRADPRGVTYHTLRHTFASWLVMEGIDLYTVAQLLGDTLQMVEKTYAHMAPDYKRRAIEALKGVVRMPDTAARNDTASATTGEK